MEKFHEYGSRFKKKLKNNFKNLFETDKATNQAAPIDESGRLLDPPNPGTAESLSSVLVSTSAVTPSSEVLTVPTARQASPHPPLAPAKGRVSNQSPTPTPSQAATTTQEPEKTQLTTAPEPVQELVVSKSTSQMANVEPPGALFPAPAAPELLSASNQALRDSKSGALSSIKAEGWANLKACLDTVGQMASASGLGPLKTVIEGIAGCVDKYEAAAQGRQAYVQLRSELEDIFQELRQYLELSPTVVANVSGVCRSIQKEIDYVRSQQVRTRVRRFAEAEVDEDNILACYQRMRHQLQGLSRKMGASTLAVVEQHAMDARLEKLNPALSARYNSRNALTLKRGRCTKGTRENVLDSIAEWVDGQNIENIFWMSGMAGTGKTTLAYSLCELLDENPNRMLGASFFCSRLIPECRNVGKIIPSIAYQLAQRLQPFQYALCEQIKKRPEALDGGPNLQFESLIVNSLADPKVQESLAARTVVVVIDALDECEDATSTRQIIGVLLARSGSLPVKFVVSSRPEPAIRDQMELNDRRLVLHELDKKEVQMDIKTYLREGLGPINPSESEIEKLAERAGVLFIYAATVIRYVGYDNFKRNPRGRLESVLGVAKQSKNQTKDIDELYETILEAAISDVELEESERDDMRLILNTVVCAKSPLTVDALNGLLNLDNIDRVHAALRPLWSVLHVMSPKMTVTTLHASFPDYLTDPSRSGNSKWHCNAAAHHQLLAQRCFECILDAKPQFNICQLPSSYLYDDQVEDLDTRIEKFISGQLYYACLYWSTHLNASDPMTALFLLTTLEQFLTRNLLLWLEVMNLTKNISTTPGELTVVKQWATRHGATQELINLTQDAWRFALTIVSSPISQTTPHIYISILPFLPSHSLIRRHYVHRMHGMIGVDGTALDRRKPLLAEWKLARDSSCLAAHSPDGTLVAMVDRLMPISFMDVSSGRLVGDITHEIVGKISCLAFSPDGTRIASGTTAGAIWMWDVSNEHLVIGPLSGHEGIICSISFSHSGSRIISSSDDCTIRIWDVHSGKPVLAPLVGHKSSVLSISLSPDDSKIVSGSYDCTVCLWDAQNGRLSLNPLMGHEKRVFSVAFSSNGKFVVSGSKDRTVRVWDSQTGQTIIGPFSHQEPVTMVAISPDSRHILAGLKDGFIQIWDAITGKAVSRIFNQRFGWIGMLGYSSDGTRIISHSSWTNTLCLFDALSAIVAIDSLPGHTEPVRSIDISPDGHRIVSGSHDNTLCVWDAIQGHLIHGPLTGHTDHVNFVRYSPNGNRILSCSSDGTIRQWNAQTGGSIQTNRPIIPTSKPPVHFRYPLFWYAEYSPESNYLATLSNATDVCVWDSKSGKRIIGPNLTGIEGRALKFSGDGTTLITGWEDGSTRIWSVQSGELIASTQPLPSPRISTFTFSLNQSYYAVARSHCGDYRLITHQMNNSTEEQVHPPFIGHTGNINSVQFSCNGTHLVSGSDDMTVHIWDTKTQSSIFGPLKGHTEWVFSVAYSPDGTYVASSSDDKNIRIWNTSMQAESSPLIDWVLNPDGWVVNQESQRLIWVPPDLRRSLMSPRNTMVLSRDGYTRLNFEGAPIGDKWEDGWQDG